MGNKKISLLGIFVCFCMLSTSIFLFVDGTVKASEKAIYVDNAPYLYRDGTAEKPYERIEYAISIANEGDTIYVFGGIYNESFVIDKKVNLIGGIDDKTTFIEYKMEHKYTVEITADYVTLEDVEITDPGNHVSDINGALLHITGDNVIVQRNNVTYCIRSYGIFLDSSVGNVIGDNRIDHVKKGIYLLSSDTNDVINNNISNCTDSAVEMRFSDNNRFYDNRFLDCNYGVYARDSIGVNVTNNSIKRNKFYGIYFYKSNECFININNISKNILAGIRLISINSRIVGNDFFDNSIGVDVDESSGDNIFTLNYFIENNIHVREKSVNYWYEDMIGNYWDDYKEVDRNKDGIGDTPYSVDGDTVDMYPLGFFLKPPARPSQPSPIDGKDNVGLKITLSVKVTDPDSHYLDVYFYGRRFNDTDISFIGVKRLVASGGTASVKFNLPFDTTYAWYAVVNDSKLENTSQFWFFTTKQTPPKNEKPVADMGGPYSGSIGQAVNFNASDSYDPDGQIVFFRWNFGDQTSEILDDSPAHVYYSAGDYTITLTVIDNDGRSATTSTIVSISSTKPNIKPVAVIGVPSTVTVGKLATFNASGSYDTDGNIVAYRWDFDGNGLYDTNWLTTATTTYTYDDSGTYSAVLEVKDNNDETSTSSATVLISTEKKQPGFELVVVIGAILVFILLKRKRIR